MISVRRRLLVGLLALVLTVDGLAGFLSYRRALHSTSTLLDYQLRQMALSLRDQGAAAPNVSIPPEDQDFDFVIQIWDSVGTQIYTSRPASPLTHSALLGYTDLIIDEESWRAFAYQTPQRVIQVAQPWRVRKELAGSVALRTLAPLLILTPLLAIAIWWTVIGTLAPIGRIVGEVKRRDADSLAPLLASDLPREIEPLITELNRLMERLSVAFQAQRSFVSDAAHELRSPLTALRLQLQLLSRADEQSSRDEALSKLGIAVDRCGSLVQQLLTLARLEPGSSAAVFSAIALDVVVRDAIADSASLAVSRGTDLALDADAGISMMGDEDSLRVLVRNLVDNAVRYTPPGGRVLVRLLDEGAAARLEVEDSGPGIPEAERGRVFDRFYRGPEPVESGSGLGLAIVKAIVERHHATIGLDDARLGGLRVMVVIPKSPGGQPGNQVHHRSIQ